MPFFFAQTPPQTPLPHELDRDRKPAFATKGDCLIANATIYTVTRGVVPNGSILIRNGKIAAVGANLEVPPGIQVIDAKGRIVTPGLIDAHTHLASDAVNEGSDAITPEVRIRDVLDPNDLGIYQKVAGGNTASLALHGSANPIGGESLVIKHKYRAPADQLPFPGAPRIVKFALGENVTRANSSSPSTRFPGTRMGVEATYRRAFTEARNYMAAWDRYRKDRKGRPPRKDVRLEALADMLRGDILIHSHGYRQDELFALVRISQEFGLKLVALQHALEAYKIAPEIAKAGIGASIFMDHWNFKIEATDAIPYSASILQRAGVLVSVHTDSGGGITPFNLEAAKAIRYGGVTPDQALRMVTINPARQLGIDGRAGSIEVGKDADIAIWDGHPLSVYSRCAVTLIDGEVVYSRRDAFGLDAKTTHPKTLSLTSLGAPKPVPTGRGPYAIVGGTVHPINGPEIVRGTVVVENGKILSVGRGGAPRGATVLDASGCHVYPGFIDAGSEMGIVEYASTPATEDSNDLGTFQPDLVALAAVDPETEKIPVARHGGVTAALSRPQGPTFAGQSSLLRLAGYTTEQLGMVRTVGLHLRWPESNVSETSDALEASIDAIEQRLLRARRYAIARRQSPATPVDPKLAALAPYANGEATIFVGANTSAGIGAAVAFAKRLGLRIVIEGGKESWKKAELLAKEKIPVLLPLPIWASPAAAGQASPIRDYDPVDSVFSTPAILHRAGVRFAFQSGTSEYTSNLPMRAGYACAYGLPRAAALRALTLDAAEIFGVADRIGSLEAGKSADLFVVEGDPLDLASQVRYMFINGQPVSLESKWTQLNDKYKVRK
ncbi:MAG: amidohydrolase family protein [Fimbriimonas sp.]